jgi:hypothetical protein
MKNASCTYKKQSGKGADDIPKFRQKRIERHKDEPVKDRPRSNIGRNDLADSLKGKKINVKQKKDIQLGLDLQAASKIRDKAERTRRMVYILNKANSK